VRRIPRSCQRSPWQQQLPADAPGTGGGFSGAPEHKEIVKNPRIGAATVDAPKRSHLGTRAPYANAGVVNPKKRASGE